MSAFVVWQEGTWSMTWEAAFLPAGRPRRDATPEEETIMQRIWWKDHDPDDCAKLKRLIASHPFNQKSEVA